MHPYRLCVKCEGRNNETRVSGISDYFIKTLNDYRFGYGVEEEKGNNTWITQEIGAISCGRMDKDSTLVFIDDDKFSFYMSLLSDVMKETCNRKRCSLSLVKMKTDYGELKDKAPFMHFEYSEIPPEERIEDREDLPPIRRRRMRHGTVTP